MCRTRNALIVGPFCTTILLGAACQSKQDRGAGATQATLPRTLPELTVAADAGGPSLVLKPQSVQLRDERGNVRAGFSVSASGVRPAGVSADMYLGDDQGRPRLFASVGEDGESFLWLISTPWPYRDGVSVGGIQLQVDKSGHPRIHLVGENGPLISLDVSAQNEARLDIMCSRKAGADPGLVSLRVEGEQGSVTLRDIDGRVIWSAMDVKSERPTSQPGRE